MIFEPRDFRRSLGRWFTVFVIVAVAAMIGIRSCSVRQRAHHARRGVLQSGGQLGGALQDPFGAGQSGEAIPGETLDVFDYAVCAWNEIQIGGSDGGATVVVGDVHNDARRGGEVSFGGDVDVYGRVTSAGRIRVGSDDAYGPSIRSFDASGPTIVHGSVAGDMVFIEELGEVREFAGLHEWAEGVDLSGDGDLDDFDVGFDDIDDFGGGDNGVGAGSDPLEAAEGSALVTASRKIVCAGEDVPGGGTDTRIADGTRSVEVGGEGRARAAYVYPDFQAYYEMASGASFYPPESDHVVSGIPGDGDAHYFASASAFRAWLNAQYQSDVLCWRCAGDGSIDPEEATVCPDCRGSGKVPAVEIAGVFYVDDETLDLGAIETHLVVHGTIVVAKGNPYRWPRRLIESPGRTPITVDDFPVKGSFTIGGPTRMHFTQTYRSDRDGGPYVWRHRTIHSGDDRQTMCAAVPEEGHALRNFPAVVAAAGVVVEPRKAGFARFQGDIGDEALTLLHGTVFAGLEIRLGGRGGWRGEPVVFREEDVRGEDDILDEAVFRIDLNEDGDTVDRMKIADVSACPVIRVGKGRYHVDINSDGVLGTVVLGEDYGEFFLGNGYALPTLVYHEGTLVGENVQVGGQCAVLFDPPGLGSTALAPKIAETGRPSGLWVGPASHRSRTL